MRKQSFVCGLLIIAVIALAIVGCDSGPKYDEEFNLTAADFNSTIQSIANTPGNYLINLSGDVLNQDGVNMAAGVNVTLKGTGSNRITMLENRSLRTAGKLTVEKITLARVAGVSTNESLLNTFESGTVEMKEGVTLSSGGVWMEANGTFIMSGGIIENTGCGINTNGNGTASITVSGGTIRNTIYEAIRLGEDLTNATLKITGGTIEGGVGIFSKGGTVTISGGTIRNTSNNAIWVQGSSANINLTISGGTLESGENCIGIGGNGNTVAISGGTIRGKLGVNLWSDSANNTLNISGGQITGEGDAGVVIGGSGHTVTMSNGKITSDGWAGVGFVDNSRNSSFTLSSRGEISGYCGIEVNGSSNTATISGGTVTGTRYSGVSVQRGSGHTVTRTGGTVTGVEGQFRDNTGTATVTGF